MLKKIHKNPCQLRFREFAAEIRSRQDQGYSMRQLLLSHIPDIGAEDKVSAAEVTAALKRAEVDQLRLFQKSDF
jgi:hypothetical protein